MAVDNKYDKFVVLQWLRKSSVQSLCVQMYHGTKQWGSRPAFWDFVNVTRMGTVCPGLDTSLLERCQKETEGNTGINLQKEGLC